VVVKVMT